MTLASVTADVLHYYRWCALCMQYEPSIQPYLLWYYPEPKMTFNINCTGSCQIHGELVACTCRTELIMRPAQVSRAVSGELVLTCHRYPA